MTAKLTMTATEARDTLAILLAVVFGRENVRPEWPSRAKARDWLQVSRDIYAPRPDIAVGPFNIDEGAKTEPINDIFKRNGAFFSKLSLRDSNCNDNPRCLIAIEIENSNKGKHMMGNIINASLLGKVGIIVTLRKEFSTSAINMIKYLTGAFERKKSGHNPANVVVMSFDQLRRLLEGRQRAG